MPGICGIVDNTARVALPMRLAEMLSAMRHQEWHVENQHLDEQAGVALGRMTLGFVNTAPQPVSTADGKWLAVMDGEIYDANEIRQKLRAAGCNIQSESHAELILYGYQIHGQDFFRQLNGSFSAALWNKAERKLILTGDRFGMRPLYYAHPKGKLLFAASIQSLLLDNDVSHAPNQVGLAQFFSFGHYWNEDTSLADVHIAPGAAWITYDAKTDQLRKESYLELAAGLPDLPSSESQILEALDAAFCSAVERRQDDTQQMGLALSGGLDARMILAAIDTKRQPLQTVSYGIEGSLDHRCAATLTELVGCKHVNYVLGEEFLSHYEQHLQRMVDLTDGQYLSQCIILPTLPLYRDLGIEVLMRGHAGELMHMYKAYAYSLDDAAMAIRDDAALESWLTSHLQGYMLSAVDGDLFRSMNRNDVHEIALESMQTALQPAKANLTPLQRIWYLFVTQRLRRETSLSLAKFGSTVEVRVPYIDNRLIELLLAVPPEMKLGETIQQYILKKHKPEFLKVVNSNTGTRIGASSMARRLSTLRMRVFAKLGLPGYQPYERLGLWLRRELQPLVHRILLGEQFHDRGVFNSDTVRTIVSQHESNQRNHTYLIMALLIYELGQQRMLARTVSDTQV